MLLLILVLLVTVVSGVFWHMRHYVLVDLRFYPRDVQQLDLRDQEISLRHYEKLQRRLPECDILWNVPFQETLVPHDVQELSVSALTQKDIRTLGYFARLEKVTAEDCSDYETLLKLWKQRPDLDVEYAVPLGGERYSVQVQQVVLQPVSSEELSRLDYLPNLKQVLCSGAAGILPGKKSGIFRCPWQQHPSSGYGSRHGRGRHRCPAGSAAVFAEYEAAASAPA